MYVSSFRRPTWQSMCLPSLWKKPTTTGSALGTFSSLRTSDTAITQVQTTWFRPMHRLFGLQTQAWLTLDGRFAKSPRRQCRRHPLRRHLQVCRPTPPVCAPTVARRPIMAIARMEGLSLNGTPVQLERTAQSMRSGSRTAPSNVQRAARNGYLPRTLTSSAYRSLAVVRRPWVRILAYASTTPAATAASNT